MTNKQVKRFLTKWQKHLRLEHWDIRVTLDSTTAGLDCLGSMFGGYDEKLANIRIYKEMIKKDSRGTESEERVLFHELGEVKALELCGFMSEDINTSEMMRLRDRIAEDYTRLIFDRRNG